ncbi:MAG: acyltransferase family protein [Wenzhouxiangellaceae bacterium]
MNQPNAAYRSDIQALRALAVMLVLIFHIWPAALPAGYIGVDVFFVISGFLITGLLMRRLQRDGRIGFMAFYRDRFRRLAPAASLVIVVTMALSYLLEPVYFAQRTALEGLASASYWQNWLLAVRSLDYLAQEEPLGPLTHYWSLSIEEQYYLLWPALLAAGYLLSRGYQRFLALMRGVILSLCLISLGLSAWYAFHGWQEGYFVTHTRVWQLGAGALLALTAPPAPASHRLANGIAVVALAVIVSFAIMVPHSQAFPGLIALLPVIASMALIHVGPQIRQALIQRLSSAAITQRIGDASYSIYLWHWPLVYFVSEAYRAQPSVGIAKGLLLLLLSIVLGLLSKRYIEDRWRHQRDQDEVNWRQPLLASAAMFAFSIGAAAMLWHHSTSGYPLDPQANADYPGAGVLLNGITVDPQQPQPPLTRVMSDLPGVYTDGCHVSVRETEPRLCVLHEPSHRARTAVISGDSHAANWIPALRLAAEQAGWRLIAITKSACSISHAPGPGRYYVRPECVAWSVSVLEQLAQIQPDIVFLARSRRSDDYPDEHSQQWTEGLVSMLANVITDLDSVAGRVIVIADTLRFIDKPYLCLDQPDCRGRIDPLYQRPDPLTAAVSSSGHGELLDMRPLLCPENGCPAVIGNVIVWRDPHHLTATYSRTLAPRFRAILLAY